MYTKTDLLNDLARMGVDPKGTLKVHLSYKAMGEIDGRGQTVLEALMAYMKDGLLVIPTHTWRDVHPGNPVMDVLYSPSCVGNLTELFRKYPNVQRSLHPTHSVAAIGKEAADFVAGEEKLETPCGEGGTYYKLWERNAQILLIGVNFARNTFIHGIEEWDGAEGSIATIREDYYTINEAGNRLYTPQYRHCARNGSETFPKLEPQAMQEGILTLGKFGAATTRLMSAQALRSMAAVYLQKDPRYLLEY